VEKTVRVHPDGEPRRIAVTGLLHEKTNSLTIEIPESAISGSVRATLRISPNLASTILRSMVALVEQPHGCAEQTISSAYPNLLLLNLLQITNTTSPKSGLARKYLQLGYDRLLDYFDANGGLTYWGANDHHPDPSLTAYGIEFLQDTSPLISVQKSHIEGARNWLLSAQNKNGSWSAYGGASSAREALYIADVLLRSLAPDASPSEGERTHTAVERAIAWAAESVAAVGDPYSNALRVQLSFLRKRPIEQQISVAELLRTIVTDRTGTYWSGLGPLPFYAWGRAASVENTAIVVRALLRTNLSDSDRKVINAAALYLIQNVDSDGIWYSGHTTVNVLKALLPLAADQLQSGKSTHSVRLMVNGIAIDSPIQTDSELIDAPIEVDISQYLHPGANGVKLNTDDSNPLATGQISASFYVPWGPGPYSNTATGREYGLDFTDTCDADNIRVGQVVSCRITARRFGSGGYGMLLAEVGLPPGAEIDRESLAKLLAAGLLSRYELQPDRLILYLWPSNASGSVLQFQFTPRYSIRAKSAPAVLYDYYNPEERVVLPPKRFEIQP
jgi:uncharacterized protein YfaS (alpha-2-macroglobulin family)